MTYATLKILIEYCYDDYLDWAAGIYIQEEEDLTVITEKLEVLLDILVAADRWLIRNLYLNAYR